MLLRNRSSKPAPPPVLGIERKEWLKALGITFHEDPVTGIFVILTVNFLELLVDCVFLVCKYCGYTKDQLSKLFDS